MHLNATELLQPVFDFLDGLIRDYGDILFMLFAYAAIPFLIWVLCGGLRRKFLAGKPATSVSPVVVIYLPPGIARPPPEPLPPLIGQGCEPCCSEFGDYCSRD
jgi:hypothetical protein